MTILSLSRLSIWNDHMDVGCIWCIQSKPLTLTVHMQSRGFTPGEKIEVILDVNNQSSQDVAYFSIGLFRIITYASNQTVAKNKSEIVNLSSFQTNGIRKNHAEQLTVFLLVPPGPPTEMNSSSICKIRYDIEIKTYISYFRNYPKIRIPITIGTYSLLENSPPKSQFSVSSQSYFRSSGSRSGYDVEIVRKIRYWKRYVDDVLAIIDKDSVDEILSSINFYNSPKIEFTIEKEKYSQIAFLDMLIIRQSNNTLRTRIYRKSTHTDRYLNYKSFHHISNKMSVVDALTYRAFAICDEEFIEDELSYIRDVLKKNNYPPKFISNRINKMRTKFNSKNNTQQKQTPPTDIQQPPDNNENTNLIKNNTTKENVIQDKNTEQEKPWVAIPYVGNLSNKIAGILRRKLNWKITFTPGTKILHMLKSIKDKEENTPPGIYEIPCNDCTTTYIGETERPFKVRKEEHKGYVRRKEYKQSAIVKHITKNKGHSMNWDDSKIIMTERKYKLRKIKEGLFIQQSRTPTMNTDKGYIISNSWKPIIPILTKKP